MRTALGRNCEVIEEALPGRTTVFDDPIEGADRNGKTFLPLCLQSHQPIDLVIVMLGTNDLKIRFSVSAFDIANGAGVLADIVQKSCAGPRNAPPQVLLCAPPPLGKLAESAEMFCGGLEKSKKFSMEYARVAREKACHFLDTSGVISASPIDGVHLERAAHRALGTAVAEKVKKIFRD
jgi:lysophospholipase L1-like esterase